MIYFPYAIFYDLNEPDPLAVYLSLDLQHWFEMVKAETRWKQALEQRQRDYQAELEAAIRRDAEKLYSIRRGTI